MVAPSGQLEQRSDPRRYVALAITLWTASFLVVAFYISRGHQHTDVWRVYAAAGLRWLARQPLYDTRSIDEFQYFPHAAILFSPLARLGQPWGGILWRAFGWGLFAHATWRACALLSPAERHERFVIATALLIPPALTSVSNAQANLHVAALMMQAAIDLSRRRRWRVTLWLAAGIALKPIMAVMVVLVCVLYPSMIWSTALALGLLFVLPFTLAPLHYVAVQYRECWIKLTMSAEPNRFFEDLRGLVWKMGWIIPFRLLRALQLLAALGAAGLCVRLRSARSEPAASLRLFAVAAVYLMLFNARNQPNSYVIIAPAAALPAAALLLQRRTRPALALLIIVACWSGSARPLTASWLKPLACVAFCGLLIREILRERGADTRARSIWTSLSPSAYD